jgi:hypothetical protein
MLELQKAFAAMMHIDMDAVLAIPRPVMPIFARLCFAWSLHLHRSDLIEDEIRDEKKKLDVLFLGGPFVHRREDVFARLIISYPDYFDFPVAYTDRPRRSTEIDRVHYYFVSVDKFTRLSRDTRRGFAFTYEEAGHRYGYRHADLVRPNRERGRVAILRAGKTSASRARLQQCEAHRDLDLATVCFGSPLKPPADGTELIPPTSVVSSYAEHFAAHPGAFEEEVAREKEDWDLFVAGDLTDDTAFDAVVAYFRDCLIGVNDKRRKKAATRIQAFARQNKARALVRRLAEYRRSVGRVASKDPLSPAALYDVLATDKATGCAGPVTPQGLTRLYEATRLAGLTDGLLESLSSGAVTQRVPADQVEEMAAGFAQVDSDLRLGREEFEAFMEKLAEALGIDVAMLVRAFRQTGEGKHPGGEELVKKFFTVREKKYNYGSTFSMGDWAAVCRACNWASSDPAQVFRSVLKTQGKPEKASKESTIWRASAFAGLVDGMARSKAVPPLDIIYDLWRVAKPFEERLKAKRKKARR